MHYRNSSVAGLLSLLVFCQAAQAEIIADARTNGRAELRDRTAGPTVTTTAPRTSPAAATGFTMTQSSRFRGGAGSASCETGANNDWYFGYWSYKPCEVFPQTEITSETMLPSTPRGIEHFAVIRWTSDKDGTANLTGYFNHTALPSDGTIGRIFQNGQEIYAEKVLGELKEFEIRIPNLTKATSSISRSTSARIGEATPAMTSPSTRLSWITRATVCSGISTAMASWMRPTLMP